MTGPTPSETAAIPAARVAVRACALGVGVAVPLVAVVQLLGIAPADARDYVWLGTGVAVVTGIVGSILNAHLATVAPDHPRVAQRYLLGLVVNFLLQIAAVAIGAVALKLSDVKFAGLAGFACAFATVVTVMHITGSLTFARALRARAESVRYAGTVLNSTADSRECAS